MQDDNKGYAIRNQSAIHFVTFTVVNWVSIFTRRKFRDLFIDSLKFCQKNKSLNVFAYVIMSNHVHLIIQSKKGELSNLIRDIRKFTSQMILKELIEKGEVRADWMLKRFEFSAKRNCKNSFYNFWQSNFRPMEFYSDDFTMTKLNYIHMNPVRAGIVEKASDYLYCSASNYMGKASNIMEVDLLNFSGNNLRDYRRYQKDIDFW